MPVVRPEIDRFAEKVVQTEDDCWLWEAKQTPKGYGQFSVGSRIDGSARLVYAHRWSYEHFNGPIPDGMEIDHLCRVRRCVNPRHLEAVPHSVNVLRGDLPQIQLRKTHCPQRHPYNAVNTSWRANGHRSCRACARDYQRAQRAAAVGNRGT